MKIEQLKNSGLLVLSNSLINVGNFLKQVVMAWFLGVAQEIDIFLLAQIIPTIIQAMIGGGAGEISVIKGNYRGDNHKLFITIFIFICLLFVLLLGALYYSSINLIAPFYKLDSENMELFRFLSIIFILNMLPGTFTSILRPHLYSKGLYKFFTYSSVISQFAGLLFIVLTVKRLGILSFAYGIILTNIINAVWFSLKAGLVPGSMFRVRNWKNEVNALYVLFKKVFSVSLQTLIKHLATFWERTLSVRFLSGGYLSSLNYAKNLTNLPNTIILSSVLTTSYIEQVKIFKRSFREFSDYTSRTLGLIVNVGFLLQMVMLILAPLIIVVLFRRGRFDNEAVTSTLLIFNILTIGFLPQLLIAYFSRSMYILGKYKSLLLANFSTLLLQASLMTLFIRSFSNTIPMALLAGNLFIVLLLFGYVKREIKIISWLSFLVRILVITVSSIFMYYVHSKTISYYINKSNLEICLIYLPVIIILSLAIYFVMTKTRFGYSLLEKIKS